MAKQPYLEEDYCIKDYKKLPKGRSHNKAKNMSFFASIFSLFIYICVFYIFNLSPYTLLNNNIFWFFMSNTLILIIAADYEAFSSSKKKQLDLHEEYVKHSQARNHVSPYVPTFHEQVDKQCMNPKQELVGELLHEKKETIPERVLEIVEQNQPPKKPSDHSTNEKKPILHELQVDDGDDHHKRLEENRASIYRRSKSDRHMNNRAKHVVMEEIWGKSVRRLESMSRKKMEPKIEEENEFSKMTNEDLNRRVEEFIQKFNRQIRLQATRNHVYQI